MVADSFFVQQASTANNKDFQDQRFGKENRNEGEKTADYQTPLKKWSFNAGKGIHDV